MNGRTKCLSLLLAVLMLATAVPGFFAPVTATTNVQFVDVTDGNDNVFMSGETITIHFKEDQQSPGISFENTIGTVTNTTQPNLATIGSEVINGVTYWTYELNVTVSGYGILRVYVDGQTLTDLYVYELTYSKVYSIGAGAEINDGYNLLINDILQINATLTGPEVPAGYSLPKPNETKLYVPAFGDTLSFIGHNSTQHEWYFSKEFTLSQNGTFTLNITDKYDEVNFAINIIDVHVLQPIIELLPINNGTDSEQELVVYANLSDTSSGNKNLDLHYNITVKLTPGINWTKVNEQTLNNPSNEYTNESASNLTFLNGACVKVVDGTLTTATLTITAKNLSNPVYQMEFVILPENEPATINVNPTSIVKGESVSVNGAISKGDWGDFYNYTVVAINLDNPEDRTTIIENTTMSSSTYFSGTWDTSSNWPNLRIGKYEIKLIIYNSTGDMVFNTSEFVTVTEDLTLAHEPAPAEWGTYYPGDTVTFSGTFLRTDTFDNNTNVDIKVFQKNADGDWVDVTTINATVGNFAVNMTAKTYSFTVKFNAPGEFKVLVNETDIPNVETYGSITIAKHKVTLSEPSATINLGESVMIQVTTTANVSDVNIIGAPLGSQVSEAEAFNATTHLKVFNITFTTDASVKPQTYDINITVPNGEVATYELTVNDNLMIVDYPAKVVHGDDATIVAKAWANLTDNDYNLTVTGWGYNSGDISRVASGASYNETLGYRFINFTWDTSAYVSPNWQTYPTHQITVTDGWVSDSVNIDLINTSETTLDPLGTVYIGDTVNITGTTYLTPGTGKINITIETATPINLSATILNEKVGDKYKFVAEWGPIDLPAGVYNVTAHDLVTDENYTIQVTVEGALTLNTDRDTYYPDGKVEIFGNLGSASSGTITFNISWFGGYDDSINATVENGSYEAYFDLSNLPSGYTGDVKIDATYNGLVNATKTITIVDAPTIQNVIVPAEPVKAGELFNITADTNLGINGTVALKIVKADNASVVKVNESVLVGEGGAFLFKVNTTNWTAGYYNVTLSKGDVEVAKQFYVYVIGANISPVEGSLVVEPTEGVAPLTINVMANVTNTGDLEGNYTAELMINGEAVKNVTVTVPFGETVQVEISYTLEQPGVYNVTIDDLPPVQVTVEEKLYPTMDEYKQRVENASTVYFVFNNLGTPDAFSASQYISRTIPLSVRTKSVLAEDFNMSAVNSSDVVIAVGGPKVNPVTAAYEDIAPVHMVINGSNITIVTSNETFNWTAPKPWWNATEGYFIIQMFEDNTTGAFVVTIYGTDADSTAAGAYYFMNTIYPNIADYTGIRYLVGLWQDTEAGADIPLPGENLGDTSGFSAGDTITIVDMG